MSDYVYLGKDNYFRLILIVLTNDLIATNKFYLVGNPGSKRGYSGSPVFDSFGNLT